MLRYFFRFYLCLENGNNGKECYGHSIRGLRLYYYSNRELKFINLFKNSTKVEKFIYIHNLKDDCRRQKITILERSGRTCCGIFPQKMLYFMDKGRLRHFMI